MTDFGTLANTLGEMARTAQDEGVRSDSLRELPDWLVTQNPEPSAISVRRLMPLAEDERRHVLEVIASKPAPAALALALVRLGMHADPADLEVIERFIHQETEAGHLPHILITQQVQATYPVYFLPLTLQSAALSAASTIAGERLYSAEAFEKWRTAHPDPKSSLKFWESRLRAAPRDDAAQMLGSLERSDPSTYSRLLLMHDPHVHLPVSAKARRVFLRARLGPERLVTLLRGDAPWGDLEDSSLYFRAARRILDDAPALLGDHRESLLTLWRSRLEGSPTKGKPTSKPSGDEVSLARQRCIDADMAVALATMAPEGAAAFLRQALDVSHCGHSRLLGALGQHAPEETELLAEWLRWAIAEQVVEAEHEILEGIAQVQTAEPGDQNRRAEALAKLLEKVPPRYKGIVKDPSRVRVWLDVAEKLGGPRDLPAAGGIWARGTGKRQGKHRMMTPKDEARAQRARKECMDAILGWLEGL